MLAFDFLQLQGYLRQLLFNLGNDIPFQVINFIV